MIESTCMYTVWTRLPLCTCASTDIASAAVTQLAQPPPSPAVLERDDDVDAIAATTAIIMASSRRDTGGATAASSVRGRAMPRQRPRLVYWHARTYDTVRAGSIDGTDTTPHDKGLVRAAAAKCTSSCWQYSHACANDDDALAHSHSLIQMSHNVMLAFATKAMLT